MPDTRTRLVGRERHLRELRLLVDGIVASSGYVVVLSGEAGAGKTRLAEEAARLAESSGVRVGWATCWRNAAAPLSVWTDLVSAATSPPTLPDASGAVADPESARAIWVRSLAHQVRDALADQPTLLVVDDLQWSDSLSLHCLEVFVGLVRSAAIGLLCTFRDEETSGERLHRVARAGRHLVVPPLTEGELLELAVELTGQPLSQAVAARLHDRTAGNVLFARELLIGGGAGNEPGRRQAPSGATAIFGELLARLSAGGQEAMQAASVIGRRFRLDVLAETLLVGTEPLLDVIGEAESARLVRPSGLGAFEFCHPLAAEACYSAGGLPRRVRLHRDVGEAMERLRARGVGVAAVEIAHHFANAAAAGVAGKAAEYAAIAGREDMDQLAYEDAVRDFTLVLRARELCSTDDAVRADLLLGLADAHAATGDRPAARHAYETVAGLARRHGWNEILARAALGIGSGPRRFRSTAVRRPPDRAARGGVGGSRGNASRAGAGTAVCGAGARPAVRRPAGGAEPRGDRAGPRGRGRPRLGIRARIVVRRHPRPRRHRRPVDRGHRDPQLCRVDRRPPARTARSTPSARRAARSGTDRRRGRRDRPVLRGLRPA